MTKQGPKMKKRRRTNLAKNLSVGVILQGLVGTSLNKRVKPLPHSPKSLNETEMFSGKKLGSKVGGTISIL